MHLTITLDSDSAERPIQRRLDEGSLSIGRDDKNDWTLSDPSKLMSRQHCLIERRGDGYWLTDQSSNGTFLNGSPDHVGDHSVRLNDGDWIKLGSHVLRLHIDEEDADQTEPADPFAIASPDPFAKDASASTSNPSPTGNDPLSVSGIISTSWLDQDESQRKKQTPLPTPPADNKDFFDEFVPPQKEHYHVFERKTAEADHPKSDQGDGKTGLDAPVDPFKMVEDDETEITLSETRSSGRRPDPDPLTEARDQEAHREVQPSPSDMERVESEPATTEALEAFLEGAGIAGDVLLSDREPPAKVMRRLGENYALMAEGLRQLLDARAMVKNEAGLEQTRIGGANNNPLKTAVRKDEAVLSTISHKGPGYLTPRSAIEAALNDLKTHEIAMIDGLHAALKGLLKRLSPDSLEKQLSNESTFRALMAGGRNAMYWRLLKERYADIAERSEQHFMGDFNREFARAYQRRSKSL